MILGSRGSHPFWCSDGRNVVEGLLFVRLRAEQSTSSHLLCRSPHYSSVDSATPVVVGDAVCTFVIPEELKVLTKLSDIVSTEHNVHVVLLVYNISDAASVNGLIKWWKVVHLRICHFVHFQANKGDDMSAILVGTHSDSSNRAIPAGAVSSWAQKNEMESFDVPHNLCCIRV